MFKLSCAIARSQSLLFDNFDCSLRAEMPFPVDGLHARRQIRLQICLQTNWNRLNLNWHPFPWLCGNRPWEMAFQFNLQNCSLGTCNYGNRYGDTTRHDFLASPVRRFCPNDKTIFAQVGWFSEKLGRQQPPPPAHTPMLTRARFCMQWPASRLCMNHIWRNYEKYVT